MPVVSGIEDQGKQSQAKQKQRIEEKHKVSENSHLAVSSLDDRVSCQGSSLEVEELLCIDGIRYFYLPACSQSNSKSYLVPRFGAIAITSAKVDCPAFDSS